MSKALGLADDTYYQGSEEDCKLIAKRLAAETGYEVILSKVKSAGQVPNRDDPLIYR